MARTRQDMEAMISQRLANDPSVQGLGGNFQMPARGLAPAPQMSPIDIAMQMNNAGQPIPENLQRDVIQYASAQGMGAADLESMFGMPAGTVQSAVQSLGIADQVPQGLGGNANFQPSQNPPPVPPDLAGGAAMPNPAGRPDLRQPPAPQLTPEQQQQMDQNFRMFGPNRPTGLQIPGFDDQGNRLAPGENNASIPRMLGPNSIPPASYGDQGLQSLPSNPAGGYGGVRELQSRSSYEEERNSRAQQAGLNAQQNHPRMGELQALENVLQQIGPNDPRYADLTKQYQDLGNAINADAQRAQQSALGSRQNQEGSGATNGGGTTTQAGGAAEKTPIQKVQDFIAQGGKSDQDIYREMMRQGVGVEQMAGAVGMPIDEATSRYTRAQELVQIDDLAAQGPDAVARQFPNGVPDNLIARYINETGQDDTTIAATMDRFGVTPDDVARATGIPLQTINERYSAARGDEVQTGGAGDAAETVQTPASTTAQAGRAGSEGQTGLAGAERAAGLGLAGANQAITGGVGQARQDVLSATELARGDIATAAQQAGGAIQTGTQQGLNALTAGLQSGQADISSGTNQGLQALSAGLQSGQQSVQQGAQAGLQALGQGLGVARGDIASGTSAGLQALGQGLGAARQDITGGTQAGLQALYQGLGGARTDLSAAQQAAAEQFGAGMGDIAAARDLASQQVGQAFGGAQQRFDPYSQVGQQALQQQAALSGALGGEAFNQAFQESPQMQFLREQGEKAAMRTAAARGGLGGGNVMKELARFNTGLASQDLQRQIQNLQALGGQGLQATGQQAQLGAQAGQLQAGLQTGAASQLAAQRGQLAQSQLGTGQQMAGLGTMAGQAGLGALTQAGQQLGQLGVTGGTQGLQAITGAAGQLGQMAYGAGGQGLQALQRAGETAGQMAYGAGGQGLQALQEAGMARGQMGFQAGQAGLGALTGAGSQLADIFSGRGLAQSQLASGAGRQLSDVGMTGALQGAQNIYGTGRDISAQRFRAGQDIAANIQAQMAALAGLQEGQGINQSNLIGQQAGTLAGIQAGAGQNTANLAGGAAGQLANVAMGGAQTYNPAGLPGVQNVPGMIPELARSMSGIGTAGQANQGAPVTTSNAIIP